MNKHSKVFLIFLTLTTFLMQGGLNGINPQIAAFAAKFPTLPLTTVMLIATLPILACIPATLGFGFVVSKLRIKGTLILGLLIYILGGISAYLFPDNFYLILVSRAIVGLGYGLIFPMGATLVISLFKPSEQPRMMGFGNTFINIGSMAFALGGAALVSIAFNNIWFVHLIMAIPLVLAFFLDESEATAVSESETEVKAKEKIPGITWFWVIFAGAFMMFFFPVYIFMSSIITSSNMGTTNDASFILSVLAIAAAISAMLFGNVYGALGKKIIPLAMLILAVGSVCIAYAQSMPMMYVAIVLMGFAFAWVFAGLFIIVAEVTPESLIPTANGYLVTATNTFGFLAVYVLAGLSTLFGKSGDLRFSFVLAAGVFIIMAIGVILFKPGYTGPGYTESIEK